MNNYDMLKNDIEKNINDLVNDLDLRVESNSISLKNSFIEWMSKNNFEPKTISNYVNSIEMVSKEAINESITNKEIFEISELEELDKLMLILNNNDTYLERKEASHNTNSAAMSAYRKFIISYNEKQKNEDVDIVFNGFNKIYYGVPGSGKSFTVSKEFNKDEYKTYRTTFHPEYTNSDFVGQIIPCVKENKVEYTFHPGPFTLALKYSLENKNKKVCLVIEEINRGNSSAIFGDIFQLLDRDKTGKSKYDIYNGPILDYLSENGIKLDSVYIPSNMWIIATMNTSDQNVFTLDTAFKRRWKMEYIKNVFADNEESKELKNKLIPSGDKYPNITWEKFVNKINKHIIDDNSGINAEDKQLGMYFVSIEEINNEKEFAEKILSYIWDDVAKLNTTYWFGAISSYGELLDNFEKNGLDVFNNLFEEEIIITDEYTIKTIGE